MRSDGVEDHPGLLSASTTEESGVERHGRLEPNQDPGCVGVVWVDDDVRVAPGRDDGGDKKKS